MDCKECAEDLTAFLDGELSAEDSARVRAHVGICPSCAEDLRSLKESADFIESHKSEMELRPEVWNLIRSRISPADSFSPLRLFVPNRWRFAIAAVAIAAALGLGYLQYQQIQRRDLDQYISQYMQEREALRQTESIFVDTESTPPRVEILPYADNPFVEVKATVVNNPFRSEDR
jgi:predicted anti-sigma-YlaC factor YlaD